MQRRTPILYYILVLCLAASFINGFAPAECAADTPISTALELEKIKPQFIPQKTSIKPWIIFEVEMENSIDLYSYSPDQKTEALTDRKFARYPSPSADGMFVFYQDSETDPFRDADVRDPAFDPNKRDPKFLFQIYKLDMKTKKTQRISDGSALDSFPVVSPSGDRLALCSRAMEDRSKWQIITMDFNGKQREPVNSADTNSQLYASWSPDGKKIAYISVEWAHDKEKNQPSPSTRLMVRDIEKKTNSSIPTKGVILSSLSWSPAGDQIAFDVVDPKTEKYSIWKINVDGTNMEQLTEGAYDREPSWFPDGTKLIFSRARDENSPRSICAVELATKKVIKLLSAENATLQYPKVYNAASIN
jgi:Tol biopolymer transport system component